MASTREGYPTRYGEAIAPTRAIATVVQPAVAAAGRTSSFPDASSLSPVVDCHELARCHHSHSVSGATAAERRYIERTVTGAWIITANSSLNDDELNSLFAMSWPSHAWRPFGATLARSLVHLSARAGARLVGFANVATDGGEHGFLLDPTVAPEFRRQGLGRTLVRRAIDESRARGARWLHVDYPPELEPFYRSAGFHATKAGLVRLDATIETAPRE